MPSDSITLPKKMAQSLHRHCKDARIPGPPGLSARVGGATVQAQRSERVDRRKTVLRAPSQIESVPDPLLVVHIAWMFSCLALPDSS